MPFETFKRQRAPVSKDPAVTIQKRGTFSLNKPAYDELQSPEALEMLCDRENQLIGMRKVDPSTDHAYIVRPLGRGGNNWLISGRAFTVFYDIPTETARRWPGRMDGDMLVVDLKQSGVEVTGNRSDESSPHDDGAPGGPHEGSDLSPPDQGNGEGQELRS